MKININNSSAIEKALKEVNKNAARHTVHDCQTLHHVMEEANDDLKRRGVSKKSLIGTEITFIPGGPHGGYSFNYLTTKATIKIGHRNQFFLVGLERIMIRPSGPNSRDQVSYRLSAKARDEIMRAAFANTNWDAWAANLQEGQWDT